MEENQTKELFHYVHIDEPTVCFHDTSDNEGIVTIAPLARGYGVTLGNSLRRVMLSSLPGAAAVSAKILSEGVPVLHEFQGIFGAKEDVCEIVLNVKGIVARLHSEKAETGYIHATGPTVVTAGDISGTGIEIINPAHRIATLSDEAALSMEIRFDHGVGYTPSERNRQIYSDRDINVLYVDSVFTPVTNVSYAVESMRVGSRMDYDRLTMQVTTDGSLTASTATVIAAQILKEHFGLVTAFSDTQEEVRVITPQKETKGASVDTPIENLDLTVRSFNCLKRAGIDTVGVLLEKSEEDMRRIRNLGAKSLTEIKDKIRELGFSMKEDA